MSMSNRNPHQILNMLVARFFDYTARKTSGAVAVEFAFVIFPFLIVLFAILETGYIFLTQMVVEGATATASREIRTGSVQQSTDPLLQFQAILCDNTSIVQCDELVIDVRSFPSFPDISSLPAVPSDNSSISFDTGDAGEIVLVRVGFGWDYITPFLQNFTSPGGETYVARAVFRVEPFQGAID